MELSKSKLKITCAEEKQVNLQKFSRMTNIRSSATFFIAIYIVVLKNRCAVKTNIWDRLAGNYLLVIKIAFQTTFFSKIGLRKKKTQCGLAASSNIHQHDRTSCTRHALCAEHKVDLANFPRHSPS